MAIDGIKIALCVIGAFYAFAGYAATRAGLTSHFLDRAIAAIGNTRPSRMETARTVWLLAAATLVFAGGVALLFLIDIAAWLFLASALGQALYLFYVAPRIFDAAEAPDAAGRRQSTNAFVVYALATAFVLWALSAGKLTSWQDAGGPLLALVGGVIAAHLGYIIWTVGHSPSRGASSTGSPEDWDSEGEPDVRLRDLSQSTRIKVMADYYTHPLWAIDEDAYGDFPPESLDLSPELTRDLNAWAEEFTASLDPDNPGESRWSDEERRAHEARARPLAIRLARERPDRMIYVLEDAVGVVEVRADEEI
jgi:hypothetical protein